MKRLLLLACSTMICLPVAAADTPAVTTPQDAANLLLTRLGAALKQEMSTRGPVSAISVCRDLAPKLAGEISRETGWKVTRVSLRPRNPMLGMADDWEQRQLLDFDARTRAGAAPATLQHTATMAMPTGKVQRYLKAIPVQTLCLSCHGSREQIPADVSQALARDYPHDRATGYLEGMIRGAVSVTRPLD